MFEKRVYCMDEELCDLAKQADELGGELNGFEGLLVNSCFDESDSYRDIPNKTMLKIVREYMIISAKYSKLENQINKLWMKRCVWRRIPPFKFWFKK